jgi:NAD-dependent deacetylase
VNHEPLERQIERLAEELVRVRSAVALTGAGISVESGIPDFRSPGGLWQRFDPMQYATVEAFESNPDRVWTMLVELDRLCASAKPNAGHLALARLEAAGVLLGIVTQNIDNLHQAAGSRHVVEFHGNGARLLCPGCGARTTAERVRGGPMPPKCACGRVLKPDVVLFGEMIPADALEGAADLVAGCRVMFVVGTSATVAPASLFPLAARRAGALLVEVNLGPTEITHHCDVKLHAPASETLPALADRVEKLLAG